MKHRSQRGITLVELTIAVTIILILGAMSIPNILRARQSAYEASAAGFLHTVQTEQVAYKTTHGTYASSFNQLPGVAALTSTGSDSASGLSSAGNAVVITDSAADSSAGGATSTIIRQSYIFNMTKKNDEQWQLWANPVLDRVQGQYFYTDESGANRAQKGAPPSTNSGYTQ